MGTLRKTVGLLLAALVTVVPAACGNLTEVADPLGANIGDRAPEFRLRAPEGDPVQLSDLDGRPRVIYFWASWCGTCTFELPLMDRFAAENAGKDLVVMTVNVGKDPEFVADYLDEYAPDYQFVAVVDPLLDTFKTYRILAFPTTFFIGPDGKIEQLKMGRIAEETLREYSGVIQAPAGGLE
jgi:thiol-disulfide isomerase/thioredoxin